MEKFMTALYFSIHLKNIHALFLLIRKFPQKSCTVEHYFTGIHDLNGKYTDDFFRKTHAPLYLKSVSD